MEDKASEANNPISPNWCFDVVGNLPNGSSLLHAALGCEFGHSFQYLPFINMKLVCQDCYCATVYVSWGSMSMCTSLPAHFGSCDFVGSCDTWVGSKSHDISELKWCLNSSRQSAIDMMAPILQINEKLQEQLVSHYVRCSWWYSSNVKLLNNWHVSMKLARLDQMDQVFYAGLTMIVKQMIKLCIIGQ